MRTQSKLYGENSSGVETPVQVSDSGEIKTVAAAGSALVGKVAVAAKASATGDTEIDASTVGSDGMSNTSNRLAVNSRGYVFNETTWDRLRGNTNGQFVQGNVASGVADAGNPILQGGYASSTFPSAVSAGQRARLWLGLQGQLQAAIAYASTLTDAVTSSFVTDGAGNVRVIGVQPVTFNGTNADRMRGNHEVTVLASAARTTSNNSSDITNYNGQRLVLTIDITAVAGSPSLTFTIKYKDSLSGKYVTILASAALTGTGTTMLQVGPGLPSTANVSANSPLPRLFRVEVTAGTADSVTYSVSANITN